LFCALVIPAFGQSAPARIRQTLFVPNPLPALATVVHNRFEPEPGIVAERVSYSTQLGFRVPAIVYRSSRVNRRAPGLIVVNGHGGDKFSWYAFYTGVLYARAGAVVLTYDPAGEGERNRERKSGTRSHDAIEHPAEMGRRMGGLMMTDLMQAVSYLSSRPEVDPSRIGAMGYSMGSFVLALGKAADPRLKAAVLAGGGNLDGADGYWDRSKPMCQAIPYRSLSFLGDRPAAIFGLHAQHGPTLIINGTEDSVVNMPQTPEPFFVALRKRISRPGVLDTIWSERTSHRPYFVTRPAALWFEKHLDFPNWTAEQIGKMPETHIGEWARERRVEMDPGYATEHREAGTRALGANVPGMTRVQLSVFSDREWASTKQRLVHESWVEAARARLTEPKLSMRGTYSHPKPFWERGARLDEYGVNSVFVHSGGITKELADRARSEGARVYAEFATLNGRGYVEKHPEAWPVNEKGEKAPEATWFLGACPTEPGFRAWRMQQLDDLLDRVAVDGVWMDYLHWHAQFEDPKPVLPETCFSDSCLTAFARHARIELPPGDAATRARWIFANHDRAWRDWRVSVIIDWAREIRDRARRKRPGILVGNYQCPWTDEDFGGARRRTLGLDLDKLAEVVDVFSPMVYHGRMGRSPEWVGDYMRWFSDRLRIRPDFGPRLWPIVQAHNDPGVISPAEFARVMELGASAASTGVMMFTIRSVADDPQKMEVMKRIYAAPRESR
jgi:dienelactone hydrolase